MGDAAEALGRAVSRFHWQWRQIGAEQPGRAGTHRVPILRTLTLADKTVCTLAGGALLTYLERQLTLELIHAMAENKPERVVCVDEGFEPVVAGESIHYPADFRDHRHHQLQDSMKAGLCPK